ncbi:MAG: hypothetical protein AB8B89_00730 [Gammaproteobacteria bacterium]
MIKLIVNVSVLLFSQSIMSEGFDYYAHMNKYAKCEALQNVVANIASESEQEFYQHELHHASLDSRIIALEFAKAGRYEKGLVDELYLTYLDEYRDLLKKSEEVEVFVASLSPHVEKCRELNEMQVDIILRKREEKSKPERYLQ